MVGAGIYDLKNGRRTATKLPAPHHHVLRWELMTHAPICHSSICMRRSKLQEHQLSYDATVDLADDFELYHRIAAAGRIAALEERLVLYRVHPKSSSSLRGQDMSTRGSAILARAHLKYLGLTLDADEFAALWRAATFLAIPQSPAELLLAGNALATLLQAYLRVANLTDAQESDVRLAASLQWWEFVNLGAYEFGPSAYALFHRIDPLTAFRPSAIQWMRPRLGRIIRKILPRMAYQGQS